MASISRPGETPGSVLRGKLAARRMLRGITHRSRNTSAAADMVAVMVLLMSRIRVRARMARRSRRHAIPKCNGSVRGNMTRRASSDFVGRPASMPTFIGSALRRAKQPRRANRSETGRSRSRLSTRRKRHLPATGCRRNWQLPPASPGPHGPCVDLLGSSGNSARKICKLTDFA